jgi:adenylate cyclase
MERRLAAILIADVVGYSRLMKADDERTLSQLESRRSKVIQPVVVKHHGRIVKYMGGDSVLAEFGSAVNAVVCAVELQAAMSAANEETARDQQIILRIGLNLGDIIVEGNDLHGDGVNIAARLQTLAPPGGICVSGNFYDEVNRKVDLYFEDLGEHELKNVGAIRVFRVISGPRRERQTVSTDSQNKPSIAVLPFVNMSNDPGQEYFSDGITEDVITQLSHFRNLLVIARNSSFAYKGKPADVAIIASELGVEYVLEGSVRRIGQRVRITAQLIDARTGKHIWAERYDRELVDVFAVQDEVSFSIVGTLAVELEGETLERAQRKRPENLRAYEHWLRGKRVWTAGQNNLEARRHFELAVRADPTFSRAYSGLARTYVMEGLEFPLADDLRKARETGLEHARHALELDEADYQAHSELAWLYLHSRDHDRSRKHIERAIQLNPNHADTLADAAYLFAMFGEPAEGIRCGKTALRLNPYHSDWYLGFLSDALFTARNYSEALAARLRAPDAFIDSHFFGAAILAYVGRFEDAAEWVEKGVARLKVTPAGALAVTSGCVVELLLKNNPYRRQEDQDHFAQGMRKAGVPG